MSKIDHPMRAGAMLRRRHKEESTACLMEIVNRYEDVDSDAYLYEIACPTHTGYHWYYEEDLEDCFEDTGLTNEEPKPVMDREIRELYQRLHDQWGEHSFHMHHDHHTGDPIGERCIHCGMGKENSERA